MRQTFDSKTPVAEQIKRIIKIKAGHKHMHRNGPGRRSEDQHRKAKQNSILAQAKWKRIKAKAQAYWKGEVDEHP